MCNLIEKDKNGCFNLECSRIERVSNDCFLYTFMFPNANWTSGIWAGGYFTFYCTIDGREVTRKYTPISTINGKGEITFLIKIYRPTEMKDKEKRDDTVMSAFFKEMPKKGGLYTMWLE